MEILNRGNFSRVKYDATSSSLPDFPGFSLIIDIIDVFGNWIFKFCIMFQKQATSGRRTADTAPKASAATNWLDGMRCETCMYLLVAISNIFEYLSDRHIITISAFNSRCYQVFYTKKSCLHTPLSCCMRHSSWQLMTEVNSEQTFDLRHASFQNASGSGQFFFLKRPLLRAVAHHHDHQQDCDVVCCNKNVCPTYNLPD